MRTVIFTLASLFMVTAVCEATPVIGTPPIMVAGVVKAPKKGAAPPARLVVLWVVSSGSPDFVYKWGEGKVEGAKFTVKLPGAVPPAGAHNTFGTAKVAVGIVVAVPADAKIPPDGKLDDKVIGALFDNKVGGASRFAIIHRTGEFAKVPWPSAFKAGRIGCGMGKPAAEGKTFDTFVPVDCGKVELIFGTKLDWVNWT